MSSSVGETLGASSCGEALLAAAHLPDSLLPQYFRILHLYVNFMRLRYRR